MLIFRFILCILGVDEKMLPCFFVQKNMLFLSHCSLLQHCYSPSVWTLRFSACLFKAQAVSAALAGVVYLWHHNLQEGTHQRNL